MTRRKARRTAREGSVETLRPKALGGLMARNETVLVEATIARRSHVRRYLFTLGLFEFWRRRQNVVLTDRQILLGHGLLSRHERSIPLKRVESVSLERTRLSSYVALRVREGGAEHSELIGPFPTHVAQRISSEIVGLT